MTLTTKAPDTLILDDVKDQLVVEHTMDDVLIQTYIDASLNAVELYTSAPVTQEDYEATKNDNDLYKLIYSPDTIEVTLAGTPVDFSFSYDFPLLTIISDDYDLVEVQVKGRTLKTITHARKLMIGSWYNSREDETRGYKAQVSGSQYLLDLSQESIL